MFPEYEFTNGNRINIGTMFCIGRNYIDHAKEMGNVIPAEPVVFIKPAQAFVESGSTVKLPDFSNNVHHEVELVVLIGKDCADISEEDALSVVAGYAVGIDLTLRDIQSNASSSGKPWATAKGFRQSAPISKFVPVSELKEDRPVFDLELKVNGITRQSASTATMERSVEVLISYLSKVFTLKAGDVIFTGTPQGVSRIESGDVIEAELKGRVGLKIVVE